MGTCIICGVSAEGRVCESHQEDVAFEFRGDRPEQLVPRRYYRGTVDGFADFGVFVDIGDQVTGLLHKSEIDGRLESVGWEPGDTVYVQVLDVHDNGNIDLGWSIRQSPREFRGRLIHDPTADEPEFEPDAGGEDASEAGPVRARATGARSESEGAENGTTGATDGVDDAGDAQAPDAGAEPEPEATGAATEAAAEPEAEPASVDSLADRVGDRVRLEGELTGVRQTAGPTVFELTDETGSVDCAAFESAGERAYPEAEVGAAAALVGRVERHRGELQVETERLELLEGDAAAAVAERLAAARDERARPPGEDLLTDDPAVEAVRSELVAVATELRRAVLDERPVVVRHAANVDGYVAGAAVERALLPLVREVHEEADAEYHYLDRRPLEDGVYDMDAAVDDVTDMLDAEQRHGEAHPLVVFAGAGETAESLDGFDLLGVYDADRVVVTAGEPAESVAETAAAAVGADGRSAATAAANVGVLATPAEREALAHLPAISYWGEPPEAYATLAGEHGYDAAAVRDLRAAVALQAFYQSRQDKRELVQDLFWSEENRALAAEVAEGFRDRLEAELETAAPHVEERRVDGVTVRVLDVEAFTHRYDFPPAAVLLDELHRREATPPAATVGIEEDSLRLRTTGDVDVAAVAAAVAEQLPGAGVRARGGREGRIEFLRGERERVGDAVVDEVVRRLDGSTDADAPPARED